MFSMTTMASSTTRPVASVSPNRVSVLIEKPNSLTNAKVPISDTGSVSAVISTLRQPCRNRKITRMTSAIASASVVDDLVDRRAHRERGVGRRLVVEARRKRLRQALHLGEHGVAHVERVGGRQLEDADARPPVFRRSAAAARSSRRRARRAPRRACARPRRRPRAESRCRRTRRARSAGRARAPPSGRSARRCDGGWPTCPAATWRFCSCSARVTSCAVSLRRASSVGSSQSRIENLRSPKMRTSPTPRIRFSASFRLTSA